ncbi:DUF4351 domain-containing protein [soil metagenome]
MSTQSPILQRPEVVYPDCDGQPMSDNTLQFEWISTIKWGLEALFRDDPEVFVAGDLLWYPVEGDNKTRAAPDAMVAIGRPKGYRGSYKQWEEGGIAPQVVFEVLSPGNRLGETLRKHRFYEKFGVEEYYIYDPDDGELAGCLRSEGELKPIPEMPGWVSPRLGVRFELEGEQLRLFEPSGRPFASYMELLRQRDQAEAEVKQAQQEREQAQQERERERQRADRLAEQLRALGIEPES